MTLIDTPTSIALVWVAVPLGWLLTLFFRRSFKIRISLPKTLLHILMHASMLTLTLIVIPGWTHPLIVCSLFALYLLSPFFIVSLGSFEPVRTTRIGKTYIMYLNALFTVSLIGIMDLLAGDIVHYFYAGLMQVCLAISLFVRGAPAVLHGLQKSVMSRRQWMLDEREYLLTTKRNRLY